MAAGEHKKILRITKGYEQRVCPSNDIRCRMSLMYPSYCEARLALKEIMNQTQDFYTEISNALEDDYDSILFQYSSNIIAFMAARGGGKTRTMLSFSQILGHPKEKITCLKEACSLNCKEPIFDQYNPNEKSLYDSTFTVLSPIAPASLEGAQNILYVVLSRLYRYADKLLKQDRISGRITDQKKHALYIAYQKCLSGINGIKKPSGNLLEDITGLQDIADGLSLRFYFYDLVKNLLEIEYPNKSLEKKFLVIQLDDADSQMSNGYDVLEDVRKYLQIPNLIILLSAEESSLWRVVLQSQLCCFSEVVRAENTTVKDLAVSSKKYLDKLIPASHAIYLPKLEKINAVNSDRLEIQYVSIKDEQLFDELYWKKGENWTLQNTLLTMIYRKTGVLFAEPDSYLHNIIPRTMRGLNQLVRLLSTMDDIPDPFRNTEAIKSQKDLANRILEQIDIAEHNLRICTNYFEHDWIGNKIAREDDRIFLRAFIDASAENRILQAIQHLKKRYEDNQPSDISRFSLDQIMRKIETQHRTLEDFHLLFAIRTIISLESSRLILWKKRIIIRDYLKCLNPDNPGALLFDFNPEDIGVPNYYFPGDKVGKTKMHLRDKDKIVTIETSKALSETNRGERNEFLFATKTETHFSLMNYITCLLHIKDYTNDNHEMNQYDLLALQEYALTVAANWDIQKNLYYGMPDSDNWAESETYFLSNGLSNLLDASKRVLHDINNGKTIEQNALLLRFVNQTSEFQKTVNYIFQNITELAKKAVSELLQISLSEVHAPETAQESQATQSNAMPPESDSADTSQPHEDVYNSQ